jgi:hypothetical protein
MLAVAPAAAPTPAPRGPTVGSELRIDQLEPGTTATINATCRAGFVATSAGVYVAKDGSAPLRVAPVSSSRWKFRFSTAKGARPSRVTVAVSCAKLPNTGFAAPPRLRVRTVRSDQLSLGPGARRAVRLACSGGSAPVGFGFERDGGPLGSPAARIVRAVPDSGGWSFAVANRASGAAAATGTITLYASCLERTVNVTDGRGRELRQRLHIVTVPAQKAVHRGPNVFVSACPAGAAGIGTGYAVSGSATSVDAAATIPGARFTVAGDGPSSASLYLLCLNQLTRFQPR